MTNYESHKEEFEKLLLENGVVFFSVVGDTVQVCGSTDCHDCLFDNSESCSKARAEWLNKEHNQYSIPADTPVDTKVLVSNDGEEWFKRYFSHFYKDDPNPYVCFRDGASSWNARGYYHWQYCKLWEGDTTNVNE